MTPHLHGFVYLSSFLQVGTVSESPGGIQGEAVLTPSLQRFRVAALRRNCKFRHRSQILQPRAKTTFLSLGHFK
jgi:hypothetical protein